MTSNTKIPLNDVLDKYKLLVPTYERYSRKLETLLTDLLNAHKIDFHLIEVRIKTPESFTEKITRANKDYSDPLKEVTDFCGLRVIVYYTKDVDRVAKLIEREFQVDTSNSSDKRYQASPSEFGYNSMHFVVSLSTSRISLPEWIDLKTLKAEIQIRTVLQHAWAAISHKLQYKINSEVPIELQRKLFRLSALLELADDEFLGLKENQENLSASIKLNMEKGKIEIPIDAISIAEFLRTSDDVKILSQLAIKLGFKEADKDDTNRQTSLIPICNLRGIRTISDLKSILHSSLPWAPSYLKRQVDASREWTVSPEFVCTLIIIGQYANEIQTEDLVKQGWYHDIADRTIKVARQERK
jgi:putative GTP pyrophosphokinase